MRRLMAGLCVLGLLLAVCFLVTYAMTRIHNPIGQLLQEASQAAWQEDWETAGKLARQAKVRWDENWFFTAAVADHTPMDEVDGMFAELMGYLQDREMPHFATTAEHLAQLAQAMADSHKPSWWNLL